MGKPLCEQFFVFMNTSILFCDGITHKGKLVPSILVFTLALLYFLSFLFCTYPFDP